MGQRTAHTDDEPRQRKPCGGAPLPQDAPSSDDEDHANEELGGDGQLYAGNGHGLGCRPLPATVRGG